MKWHSHSRDGRKRRILACVAALGVLLASASVCQAQLFLIRHVLANGGWVSSSSAFTMRSTLGQAAIGHQGSAAWAAEIGYWLPLNGNPSAVPEVETLPLDRFELGPCGPNPIGARASLSFGVPVPTRVTIRLFDVAGREIRTLADADYPAGRHQLELQSRGLPSGVYLCRMTAEGFRGTYRLILAR
jgi:hypothetical protein